MCKKSNKNYKKSQVSKISHNDNNIRKGSPKNAHTYSKENFLHEQFRGTLSGNVFRNLSWQVFLKTFPETFSWVFPTNFSGRVSRMLFQKQTDLNV